MLIVEDEPLVATTIEMVAADLGWQLAGTAFTEESALKLLATVTPTVAVVDINLGPTNSFRVSTKCRAMGVPVLFVTGYVASDVPAECGYNPILAKPFSIDEFEAALGRCLSRPLHLT